MAKQHEIRHSERISVLHEAEILSGEKSYTGIIEDISTTGMNIVVSTQGPDITFSPGVRFQVKLSASNKVVNVQCEARWIRIDNNPSHGLTYRVALKVVEQSEAYSALSKTLQSSLK
jgi:hypothetical protein